THGKRTTLESCQRQKDRHEISRLSPGTEVPRPQRSNVGCKADAKQVDVVNRAAAVSQPQNVANLPTPGKQRFYGMFHAAVAKVAQEGVSGAQREKGQGRTFSRCGLRKKSVDNFVGGSIAANRNELPNAASIGFACDSRGIACAVCLGDLH